MTHSQRLFHPKVAKEHQRERVAALQQGSTSIRLTDGRMPEAAWVPTDRAERAGARGPTWRRPRLRDTAEISLDPQRVAVISDRTPQLY